MNLWVVGVTSNVGGWDKNVRCWHARVRSLVVLTKVCIAHKFNLAKFIDASLVFWIIQNTVFSQCCGSSTVLTFLIFVIRTVDHPRFLFTGLTFYTACKSSDFFLVFIFWTSICFSGLRPPHHWRCSVFWIIQNTVFSTDFLPFCWLHNLSIL